MKIKERLGDIASTALVWVIIALCLPWMLLVLIGQFLYTPIEYIQFKRSRYQQDFPRKYSLWCGVHLDNEVYTIVKENNLPVEYIKWSEDYGLHGYFVSGDTLLNFTEPFFYDEKKQEWMLWPGNAEDENDEVEDVDVEHVGEDNTDDCVGVEAAKELMLQWFAADVAGRECRRVAVFYERQKTERIYGKEQAEALKSAGCILYERGALAQAIREVIEQ
ncbi:MAG: hypothetical protein IKL13_06835 [Clostridia bacterium]|nr:hypothetical protein [Clostridia bacterium]